MIDYSRHVLSNGLTVLLHEDHTTPLVAVNTLYRVGARDEEPDRTGFAHLFEHLMFGGTPCVEDYDFQVNSVGGESNAFTNNDYTDYYLTVPSPFLETALWLESDRMRRLTFSQRSLEVQQHVVTEEYHQRYVNQPYGDAWMLLRPLCYKVHPYRWCTIGRRIEDVQSASLDDVRRFFFRHYRPNNAILAIAGAIDCEATLALVERWYGDIEPGQLEPRCLPQEPAQCEARSQMVHRAVPADALYMAYPTCGRAEADFAAFDLLSDVLSNGRSSRLYHRLVREQAMFTEVDAYVTGEADPGLFVDSGKLSEGVDPESAARAVDEQLQLLTRGDVGSDELQKVVNKAATTFAYSQYKAIDRAMSLCYYEWLGHTEWVNTEPDRYRQLSPHDLQRVAAATFRPDRCSTLYYLKQS